MKENIYVSNDRIAIQHWLSKPIFLRSFFWYAMAVMLFMFAASCKSKNNATKDPDTYYGCSMHPQVMEDKPGKCPICQMDLTEMKKINGANKAEIMLSDQQIQLGNIHTDTILTHSFGDQIVLSATLNFDQTKTSSVSSRVMGRVERLYYKNLGDYVKRGSPLYDIYSEDLNNAKQEYLLVLDQQKTFKNESIIDFQQLAQSAKNKLLLWGMRESQILDLTTSKKATATTTFYSTAGGFITTLELTEGDYVMEGGTIVKLADLSRLWAEAQVYSSQMAEIDRNSVATVQIPDFGDREVKGRIEFINPEINPDARINLIRVSIPNPGNQLKPGMAAYVLLKSPPRNTLTLPIDAVIRDGKGATVWIETGINTYKNVMVQTGLKTGDRIEIISGLNAGDIVVISGAYLLHSEYIFKKGADPMAGHDMENM